jgi:TetR/AcrR family transcriptional repressor of nem operon
MRVSAKTLATHRAAILEQAGSLFRGRGIDGVAVADITRAAGLTHGAFYGHFPSKTALAEEACRTQLHEAARKWRERAARARAEGRSGIEALVAGYLTERHRDTPEGGCVLAALGAEAVRDPGLRAVLRQGALGLADVLAEELAVLHPQMAGDVRKSRGMAMLSAMNGGLILARMLADDPDQSRDALDGASRIALATAASG